jgi:ribosome-associated protein
VAGKETGDWIVMDFVDVVVHLFTKELRSYYDLELIWGEAPRVDWEK